MAVRASFSAIAVVFAVVLFMMSSIVSGQDIESSPSPAPSPALERGFAVANSVGASASLMLIFSLVASIIN